MNILIGGPVTEAITLRLWTDVVRRARLGATTKHVALMLAQYADSDGSRVYPGIARLAYECELSYTTIKGALRHLRKVGLIAKVGRRGDADIYQLLLHEDLLERVVVPTPAQVNKELDRIRDTYKGTYVPKLQSVNTTADEAVEGSLRSGLQTADEGHEQESAVGFTDCRKESAVGISNSLQSGSQTATTQDHDTTKTTHSDKDLRTAGTLSREADREQDPDLPSNRCPHGNNRRRCLPCRADKASVTKPPAEPVTATELSPDRCPTHGLKGGQRPDGQPHCTLCRHVRTGAP